MKEPVLFKDIQSLSKTHGAEKISVASGVSKEVFLSVKDGGGVQEFYLECGSGSNVEAVLLQNLQTDQEVFVNIKVRAEKDAQVKLVVIQEGAARSQVKIESLSLEKGASLKVFGLQNAKGTQKHAFQAHALHSIPHAQSDLQVWCVARDEAHSIFNGLVTIEKGAHHTEAFQKNKNLLLSEDATIDSFPKLFIYNDEVKCAHGSSTSTLDTDQLVYFTSRGVDRAQAETMILSGFLNQALLQVSDLNVRAKIGTALKLESTDELDGAWGTA